MTNTIKNTESTPGIHKLKLQKRAQKHLKRAAQRAQMLEDVEALEKATLAYFEGLLGEDGEYKRPPTLTGLAIALDLSSRHQLYELEKRKGYEEQALLIKKARLHIENYAEERLHTAQKPTGTIFALKNMGWTDRQEMPIGS